MWGTCGQLAVHQVIHMERQARHCPQSSVNGTTSLACAFLSESFDRNLLMQGSAVLSSSPIDRSLSSALTPERFLHLFTLQVLMRSGDFGGNNPFWVMHFPIVYVKRPLSEFLFQSQKAQKQKEIDLVVLLIKTQFMTVHTRAIPWIFFSYHTAVRQRREPRE